MNKAFEKILDRLEETDFNDIQMTVREVLLKYGFPYESVIQDEVWDALDELSTNKFAKRIVQEVAQEYNEGWIPCSERLPKNANDNGALCHRYHVMTKYGVTEGWYNPDFNSWYVLMWFMTKRCLNYEIDIERGDVPKVVRYPLESGIVTAWQPLPESYQQEGE